MNKELLSTNCCQVLPAARAVAGSLDRHTDCSLLSVSHHAHSCTTVITRWGVLTVYVMLGPSLHELRQPKSISVGCALKCDVENRFGIVIFCSDSPEEYVFSLGRG